MTEADCLFVSSRGLMKSCDVYPPNPVSSSRICYDYDWASLKPGAVVYVISSSIRDFIFRMWPKIKVPIVLVSGDCDETMPIHAFSEPDLMKFLEDDRVIAWFAQNNILAGAHPKLHHIPIGMDYHTLSQNSNHAWGPKQTPLEQEETLILFKNAAPGSRELKAHANFHFSMKTQFAQSRQDAIRQLKKELVIYEETPVKRLVTWSNQTKYQFVISPLDCHRTWEALALGCFPIVVKSPIDSLYEGLPVLILESWSQLNTPLMNAFVTYWKKKTINYEKLTLKFWMDRIRSSINALPVNSLESRE